jgi:putative ABC transport system ATP-binding protein
MENNILISLSNLTKRYKVGDGEFLALKNISLDFRKGEFTGLVGPSGSGKTTLLNIIGSLDVPSEGKAVVIGKSISELTHKQAASLRNFNIGFIFQTYNLLPVYSVFENVEFALLLQNKTFAERKKDVMEALDWVGLADKAKSRPSQLSGGECQRVAIARAMVKHPLLVLADEPSANLDAKNSHHIVQTMKKLNRELKTTFIFATHDEKVMQYLDRIISLKDGEVEKDELIPNAKS